MSWKIKIFVELIPEQDSNGTSSWNADLRVKFKKSLTKYTSNALLK